MFDQVFVVCAVADCMSETEPARGLVLLLGGVLSPGPGTALG